MEIISVLKVYNLKRHYTQRHAATFDGFQGMIRSDKIAELKRLMTAQQLSFKKVAIQNDSIVKASYVVANLIAKKSKPFSDGEFIKQCIEDVVGIICPDKKNEFSKISLSHQTISRRIQELGSAIETNLVGKIARFKFFALAIDESIDVMDTAQLAIFIRGIDNEYNITEEMASLVSLKDTTKSLDLYNALKITLARFSLTLKNLSGITTDGAPAMIGKKGGLVKLIEDDAIIAGNSCVMKYHCIIHQENLCAKSLKMDNVMQVVIKIVNYIRCKGLNHRQFQDFLENINCQYGDIIYFTEIRWLSRGKMLSRFYNLRSVIKTFLESKGKVIVELEDENWNADLAFLVDLTNHLNELNIRLQGKKQLIHDMYQAIIAFQMKLKIWKDQIMANNFIYFENLARHCPLNSEKYSLLITVLIQQFEVWFEDFRKNHHFFVIFATPFSVNINILPSTFQIECIELQADIQLKDKFDRVSLIDFYKSYLPREKYPILHDHALFMSSLFGSTYICEHLFSIMKHTKSRTRTKISDEHLESSLRIATTSIEPDINELVSKKQPQISH